MPHALTRTIVAFCVAAALVALPACTRVAPPGPTTPTTRGTGSVSGDWEAVGLFADAVMAEDHARAATYVVPGSPAARYLTFAAELAAADPAHTAPAAGSWAVNVDRHLGEVSLAVVGGPPLTWTDWRFGPDGRILQWSTPTHGALETRLWAEGSTATVPAGSVRLSSALANDTALNVVLEVSPVAPVTIDCDATYAAPPATPATPGSSSPSPAPSGPIAAAGCFGAATIGAGGSGRIVLQFPGASLGGTLAYTLLDASGAAMGSVQLAIR